MINNTTNDNTTTNTKNDNKQLKDKKYEKISLILGILIFVVVSIFIVIIIVSWYNTNDDPITIVNTKNGVFLYTCNEYDCNDGYICDSNYLICKKDAGSNCNNYLECANDLFCSGICVTGPTGFLDDYCPCIPGETTCVNVDKTTPKKLCRLNAGKPCTSNIQCASNNCSNNLPGVKGICLPGFSNSAPCILNTDCESSYCDNSSGTGFCQNTGTISFTIGSNCQGICYEGKQGSDCNLPLTCDCGGITGIPGICKNKNLGISVNCSNLLICADELVCINATGSNSTCTGNFINNGDAGLTGLDICSCVFNYFNPNIPINDICINGMTANGSACYNSQNLGCNNNDMCLNSCDINSPVLATYNFSNKFSESNIYPGVNFINSADTSINAIPINKIKTPITTPFSPITLFSTSNNTIDTVFLVDKNNGLLYLVNDLTSINPRTWNQILPSTTQNSKGQNRTLKYVAFNGIFWILLFDEISSSPTNDIYTSVYWTKSLNNTNIPDITSMQYFQLAPTEYNPLYPGSQYYKLAVSESNAKAYNGSYIDIAPLNYFSDVNANNNIYYNNLIFSEEYFPQTYLPFSYNNQISPNYFIYVGSDELDLKVQNNLPFKYYYDQNIIITGNTGQIGQICQYNTNYYCFNNNTVDGSTGNNCKSYENFTFGSNTTLDSVPITFSGNLVKNYYPIINNAQTIYYNVFDYSIYSPGVTGLYTFTKDTNICNLGIDNSNIIMLCESYSNTTPPNKLDNVVVVVNKQTIAILPYRIDKSFKCAASNNAFYIISPGSCN
jgi:hypothetical protein